MKTVACMCAAAFAVWLPVAMAQEPPPSSADTEREQRQEMRKEVSEAVDAVRNYSVERRKEAVAEARRAMEETDRRAERLQARIVERWDRMDATARDRSQAAMADLRQRRNAMAEWAGGMQHGSREAWDEVKAGFVRSYHDFQAALDRARAQFDREAERTSDEKTSSQKQQEQER